MAHIASEIDYRRILKRSPNYFLNMEHINKVYKAGYLIISDLNSAAFCYPVKYFDGTLIRFYNENIQECIDMLKLLIYRIDGKLFISNIPSASLVDFKELGFNDLYDIYGLYKMDYYMPVTAPAFIINDYIASYSEAIMHIENGLFPDTWQIKSDDLINLSTDKEVRIRVCCIEKRPAGFSILRFKKNIGYGYIIKLCTDKSYQGRGIGTALINDSIELFKQTNTLPIFLDIFSEASLNFFKHNGFKIYSLSHLLVKYNN